MIEMDIMNNDQLREMAKVAELKLVKGEKYNASYSYL